MRIHLKVYWAQLTAGVMSSVLNRYLSDTSALCCTRQHPQSLETQIRDAFGVCRDAGVHFACKLPKIMKDTYLTALLQVVPPLVRLGIHEYMVENCGAAYALMQTDLNPALCGSTGLNIFNSAVSTGTLTSVWIAYALHRSFHVMRSGS